MDNNLSEAKRKFAEMDKNKKLSKIKTKEEFLKMYKTTDLMVDPEGGRIFEELDENIKLNLIEWLKDEEFFLEVSKGPNDEKVFWDDFGTIKSHDFNFVEIDDRFKEIAKEFHLNKESIAEQYLSYNPVNHRSILLDVYDFGSEFWLKMAIKNENFLHVLIQESQDPALPFCSNQVEDYTGLNSREVSKLADYYSTPMKKEDIPYQCFTDKSVGVITEMIQEKFLRAFEKETEHLKENGKLPPVLEDKYMEKLEEIKEFVQKQLLENLERKAAKAKKLDDFKKMQQLQEQQEKIENINSVASKIDNLKF